VADEHLLISATNSPSQSAVDGGNVHPQSAKFEMEMSSPQTQSRDGSLPVSSFREGLIIPYN